MKKKLLKILDQWTKPYISSGDIKSMLEGSSNAIHSLIKRAVKDEIVIRLRRDFYLISSKVQKIKPEAFEIASVLYGPSYISLESALSFHGWIPESVPIVYSVCSKRTKSFDTYIGVFSYHYIPVPIFHVGISSNNKNISVNKNTSFLIADPWKAIADLIYLRKKKWSGVISLANDLRIELDLIQYSDLNLLEKLSEIYPNMRVRKVLKILAKDFI